jgi:hypothetical protein
MGNQEERLERVAVRQVVQPHPDLHPRSAEQCRTAKYIGRALDDLEAVVGGQRVDRAMEVGDEGRRT